MKVKELLEELKKVPEDTEILFRAKDGCCDGTIYLEINDIEFIDQMIYNQRLIDATIEFKALPGFRSCIQSGQTHKADKEYWDRFKK